MSFADADPSRFDNYEAELRLVLADLTQQLDTLPSLTADARKAGINRAQTSLSEANDLVGSMQLELSSLPSSQRDKCKRKIRDAKTDIDNIGRKVLSLTSDRSKLFGSRYRDEESGSGKGSMDEQLEQRQQLLSGTERLTRSSARLTEAQRIANETEGIGAGVLRDLAGQREQIVGTRERLLESEGYTDRSIKTLRGMARRWGLPFT